MRIMLIWWDIPEDVKIYIEDVTQEEYTRMSRVHDKYWNTTLVTEEESEILDSVYEWTRAHEEWDLSKGPIPATGIERVILTGMVM